jgi:hypothetical protein
MPALIGPGGGEVGPGGGEVGPSSADLAPPAGVITYVGGVPTTSAQLPRADVGPIDSGTVGPAGGLIGPGPGYARIALPPSGTKQLTTGGAPGLITPPGVIYKRPPTNDQPPTDASWLRAAGNPIIEADVAWEGDVVREPCVIQAGGLFRMWYSGGDPEAIGYATCPDDQDVGDPANWTKYAGNPIITDARKPNVQVVGGLYRLMFTGTDGQLYTTTSVDGFTGWSTPVVALALVGDVEEWASPSPLYVPAEHGLVLRTGSRLEATPPGAYKAWPAVCRLQDGRLLMAYTDANGHHSDNSGQWVGKFSTDGGLTWGTEFLIYDDPTLWTTVMGISQVASGRIYATGWRDSGAPTTAGQGGYVFSDDGGASWSGWQAVTTSSDLNEYLTGPVVELGNGDLLVPVEITFAADGGLNNSSRLLRAPGGTLPFTEEIIVHDYSDDGHPHYESKLGLLDNGDLLMIHRRGNSTADVHEIQRSTDNGATWSEPTDGPLGYGAPSWVQLRTGVLVLITRQAGDAAVIAYLSHDRGASWGAAILVDDTFQEMEYGAPVELPDGSVLAVYSLQITTSIFSAGIYTSVLDLAPWFMLVAGFALNRWHIYRASSTDGLAWTTDGAYVAELQLHTLGSSSGPHLRAFAGAYHLWYEATPANGILPTDIYHASTATLRSAWGARTLVLEHTGSGFEDDQVARPHIVLGEGPSVGVAFLYYDGQDASPVAGAIGVALAAAVGGISINGGGVFSELRLRWAVGLVGSEMRLRWDVEGPIAEAELALRWGVNGRIGSTLTLPWAVAGTAASELRLRWAVKALRNEVQVITPTGTVEGGTYTLTFDGQTTAPIAAGASAATVQAALEALSNVAPGDIVVTGGPLTEQPLVLTFGGAYAGVDVPQVTVDGSGLTGPGSGATGGTVVPGGTPHPTPPRSDVPQLWRPMHVFDKGGAYLGSITRFNVPSPPTRYLRAYRIRNTGGMTFEVSRHSDEIDLIAADRWVLLQSLAGEEPWLGKMSPRLSAGGVQQVECLDGWQALNLGSHLVLEQTVGDGTPATAVYAMLVEQMNNLRALTGEVLWELDAQGSRPYRGDIDWDGTPLATIDAVIEQSLTELACTGRLEGGRLVPTLVVRDRFEGGAGASLHDGLLATVTSGAQVAEDPTPLVFSLRLRGLTTDLAACLPEWARWALKDITPEVVVSVDPGPFDMREQAELNVQFGLSHAAVMAQCNAIIDWLTDLYHSFLRAVHDIEGRPWHPGWAYLGPPDAFEPHSAGKDSLSRRAWKNRLELVEVDPGEPASAVMLSDQSSLINLREWLIVTYLRRTGVQHVGVYGIPTVAGISLVRWALSGSTTLYTVSGRRVVDRDTLTGPTGAFVDPYNVRVWDPPHTVSGHLVPGQYRNLRRIINGPFALTGYVDPSDGDNTFTDLGPDAAISQAEGDGSSLISKVYDFEARRIQEWDPRRDGVGMLLGRPTVYFGAPTTRPRWHIVSFNVGGDFSTQLVQGIGASTAGAVQVIEVESYYGAPDPDRDTDQFPWTATIGEGLTEEQVTVRTPADMQGTEWTVVRGANGTDPILHEPGERVGRLSDEVWDGFPWAPELAAWPEGRAWAEELLAELSRERVDLGLHVTHWYGDQLTIGYGTVHPVNVASEGVPERWIGAGRVIGWSTDAAGGETEVVVEWLGG